MKLSDYLTVHGSQTALARAVNAQPQLVWQWARGIRPVPVKRCVPIELATAGAVTRRDLRPDDWQRIWPELATLHCAAHAAPAALASPASPAKAAPA